MASEAKTKNGLRSRSFRDEDYNTRRVFLRSYPLQWGNEEKQENKAEAPKKVENEKDERKKQIKKIIFAMIQWSEGKVLVLRKVKNKIVIYVVACIPFAFKPPTGLISV